MNHVLPIINLLISIEKVIGLQDWTATHSHLNSWRGSSPAIHFDPQ